jgi:transposase-like protein
MVALFASHGSNVSATARALGIHRATLQSQLRRAASLGMIDPKEPGTALSPEFQTARERMLVEYQRKKAKGDWRKPVLVSLPPDPFRLKIFGDPHLDDPGCDAELFIEHMQELDREAGIYGVCVGDWFNNWARSLAHLWKGAGDPSDAWLVFEQPDGRARAFHARGLLGESRRLDERPRGPHRPRDEAARHHLPQGRGAAGAGV